MAERVTSTAEKRRAAVLFTGGKDSTLSLMRGLEAGLDVVVLITMKPLNPESWMFHYPCVDLTVHQAEALGIPMVQSVTRGEKEAELEDLAVTLKKARREHAFDVLISGAIASQYQKHRIDSLCNRLSLESQTPLWNSDPEALLHELLSRRFEVVFTAVAAQGFTSEWLGRTLDLEAIRELRVLHEKYGVHMALEGGEGETFVLDCPLFCKRIQLKDVRNVWRGDAGYIEVGGVELLPKHQPHRES
ncbi:MAG: diphthine--ammonia ligase [Candidatus Bathyarchaeia archaeon]